MSALFWLSETQWTAIAPHLPTNQPGAPRVDDRRVISGIVHVLKVGCRWCDCPTEYGPSTTIYNRFNRWSRRSFWDGLLEALAACDAVPKSTAIDSTYIKAQRAAFGGKGGRGRRRSVPRAAARPQRSTRSPTSLGVPTRSRSRRATSDMSAAPALLERAV